MSGAYLLYQKFILGKISFFINIGVDVCSLFPIVQWMVDFLEIFQSYGTKISVQKVSILYSINHPSSFQPKGLISYSPKEYVPQRSNVGGWKVFYRGCLFTNGHQNLRDLLFLLNIFQGLRSGVRNCSSKVTHGSLHF